MAPPIPDRIPIETVAELNAEVAALQLALDKDETEHTWELIDRAVKRFHATVRGGACKHPDAFVKAFKNKELVTKIIRSFVTERTRLSSSTLDLLASITRLAHAFSPLLPLYLPSLLRLLCRTNKLYIARASSTLAAIISHTHLPDILKFIVVEWKLEGGKSSTYRQGAVEAVLLMLGGDGAAGEGLTGGREGIERRMDDLEWVIKNAATDREPKVRATAKCVWEVYKRVWPERVAAFTGPMTPVSRRYLNITAGPPTAAAPPPATKKVAAAVKKDRPPPAAISSRPPTTAPAPPPAPTRTLLSSSTSSLRAAAPHPAKHPALSLSISHPLVASSSHTRVASNPFSTSSSRAPSRPESRASDLSASLSSSAGPSSSLYASTSTAGPRREQGFKPSSSATATGPKKAGRAVVLPAIISALPPAPPPSLRSAHTAPLPPAALPPPSLRPAPPAPSVAAAPPPPPSHRPVPSAGPFRPKAPSASTSTSSAPAQRVPGAAPPPASSFKAGKTAASTLDAHTKPPPTAGRGRAPPPSFSAPVAPKSTVAPKPTKAAPLPLAPKPTKSRSVSPVLERPKVQVSAATLAARERKTREREEQEQEAKARREKVLRVLKEASEVPLPESDDEGDVAFREGASIASRVGREAKGGEVLVAGWEEGTVSTEDSMVLVDETGAFGVGVVVKEEEEEEDVGIRAVDDVQESEDAPDEDLSEPAPATQPIEQLEEGPIAIETPVVPHATSPSPPPSPALPSTTPSYDSRPPSPFLFAAEWVEDDEPSSTPAVPASPTFPSRALLLPLPLPADTYDEPEPSHTCSIIMETPVKLTPAEFTIHFGGGGVRSTVPNQVPLPASPTSSARSTTPSSSSAEDVFPSPTSTLREASSPSPAARFLRDESEEAAVEYADDSDVEASGMEFDVPLKFGDESGSEEDYDDEEEETLEQEEEEVRAEETEVLSRSLRSRVVTIDSPVKPTGRLVRSYSMRGILEEMQGGRGE